MMQCVECIGCAEYNPFAVIYCARVDRDECVNREFYAVRYGGKLYPMYPDKYRPVPPADRRADA